MTLQKNAGAVRRFAKALRFGAWLQNLPNKITPPPFRLMQLGSAFWQSRVLYVAARLDLASKLGDETLSSGELGVRVSANGDAVYRLLRMLAAMGIFEEASPRRFRNNRISSYLRTDHPRNVRAMILMHNSDVMSRPWYEQLERGVQEGEAPFRLAHGEELFAYMNSHPDFDALFSEAMDTVDALTGDSFATDFDWGQFERIIDVGGSRGGKAVSILKHHPRLNAIVVDRAQVIEGAEAYWRGRVDASLLGRVRFEAGDALEGIPAASGAGDIYFLSAVLHGFGDEEAGRILANLSAAIGKTGARAVLMELVMPASSADLPSASFDMQMFMGTRGRERNLDEWRRLFEDNGLRLDEEVGLRSFGKLLVVKGLRHD
jgi:hypothetical protein